MRPIILALMLAIVSCKAEAAKIYLKDGSVIIGTVVKLVNGEDLILDTEHMDEVTIEWDAIEQIQDTQVVDIVTYDDRRLIGTIESGQGRVRINAEDYTEVSPEDIFSIEEVNDTFWDGFGAYTDLGMNLVRGNNQVTQVSFGGGLSYEGQDYLVLLDASALINEQQNAEDTRRKTFNTSYTRDITHRWQASAFYSYESDEQQRLDNRQLFGAYISNRFFNSRRQRWYAYAGLASNSEKFEGKPQTRTPEGMLGIAYWLRWVLDVDAKFTVFPNLEDTDRLRAEFDGTVSFDLFSDLDFKLTVYSRYDSDPPVGNESTDTGATMNLSWDY